MGRETESGFLTVVPVRVDELAAGAVVGTYTVTGTIGKGGWGAVYYVTREDGTPLAMKVLHHELVEYPTAVARFFREVHTVRRIAHPGMVEIVDLGRLDDGRPYFVMELLKGSNLGSRLRADGRMAPIEAFDIVEKVCAALMAA